MYKLKVLSSFSAAHQLSMVAEQCENLHGHNWKVEVCVTGKKLNDAGVLVDFGIVKKHLKKIINQLDHKFLNELDCFDAGNPSSENIAMYIAKKMQENMLNIGITISEVTIWESDNACATYYPNNTQ